jgi:hypothetical protein
MRIISQDGTIDVPYEYISLVVSIGKCKDVEHVCIYCHNISAPHGTRLAEYSSKEKALKAMEMLREKYLSRMELDGGYDIVNKCYVQPNYWVLPKVFQFPQDDEIEV